MTTYVVTHKTEYLYQEPASLCYNEARMLPRSFSHPLFEQTSHRQKVSIEPAWTDYRERTDFFGNKVFYFSIRQPHQRTSVTTTSHITVTPALDAKSGRRRAEQLAADAAHSAPWETVRQQLKTDYAPELLEARQFAMNSPMIATFPALADYAAPSFPAERPILEAAISLMQRIHADFEFVSGVTTITTPLAEVLAQRRGVCQDYAHLMVGCLRAQGLAARYVSGYIETLPPPGQEKLQGADASHAWCTLFVPDIGWVDFDPTNNQIPTDQHLVLAWGRDFADVTPLKGVFFSNGQHKLQVAVDVKRIDPKDIQS